MPSLQGDIYDFTNTNFIVHYVPASSPWSHHLALATNLSPRQASLKSILNNKSLLQKVHRKVYPYNTFAPHNGKNREQIPNPSTFTPINPFRRFIGKRYPTAVGKYCTSGASNLCSSKLNMPKRPSSKKQASLPSDKSRSRSPSPKRNLHTYRFVPAVPYTNSIDREHYDLTQDGQVIHVLIASPHASPTRPRRRLPYSDQSPKSEQPSSPNHSISYDPTPDCRRPRAVSFRLETEIITLKV